jgi:hypothetical protein
MSESEFMVIRLRKRTRGEGRERKWLEVKEIKHKRNKSENDIGMDKGKQRKKMEARCFAILYLWYK